MFGTSIRESRGRFPQGESTPSSSSGSASFCSSSISPLKENTEIETALKSIQFGSSNTPSPGHGLVAIAGRRREMTNTISAIPGFLTFHCNDVHHFFGVYNGFGGSEAAEFCKNKLHSAITEEVELRTNINQESSSSLSSPQWAKIMSSSFSKVREEVNECYDCLKQASSTGDTAVGSNAVVIVLSMHQIVIATCGSAKAVLCRNGVAIQLVNDSEDRLKVGGGNQVVEIAEPKVECFERSKGDDFLILASFGLWNVIDSTTACNVVRRCLLQARSSSESITDFAAAFLVKLAFSRGSPENISVVVVDLRVNNIC